MAGGPRRWTGDDPAAVSDARPWLLGGGAGRKPAPAGGVPGTTRSPERAAAMRAAGVEPVDWADAAAVDAAIAGADAHARRRCRRTPTATRCWRATATALAAAPAGVGRLSLDHRGLRRPAGRLGRRGRARSRRSTSAAAGGWRRRRAWLATGLPVHRLPARRHLRAGAQRPRPAARGAGAAGGEAGPGLQPHPRRRHRRGVLARLDGAARTRGGPTTSPTTSRRRREDVIAYAAELLGMPAPPEVPFEDGGALADGAELLGGVEAGRRTGGSRRSSGSRSPIPTIAPGCAAILAAGG